MARRYSGTASSHRFEQSTGQYSDRDLDYKQIEKYMEECSQYNVDIVEMNKILTSEKRWYEYDTLVAENKFSDNGTHIGISPRAYAVIMEKLDRKKSSTDVLLESKRIGLDRVNELQNRSKKKRFSYR